jgi:hypothetical protein
MPKKRLPKTLFIAWNYDDPEVPFLNESTDGNELVETGETIEAGVYELKEKVKLVNTTKVQKM